MAKKEATAIGEKYDPNTEIFQMRTQQKKIENCAKLWHEKWHWLMDAKKETADKVQKIRESAQYIPQRKSAGDVTKSLKPIPQTSSGQIGWLAAKPDCQLELYASWLFKVPIKLPDAWETKSYYKDIDDTRK